MKNAKKFMGLAMVLLMVLSLAPTAVFADNTGNLLTNGGFEAVVTKTDGEGEATEYLWPATKVSEDAWKDDWDVQVTGNNFAATKKGTHVSATQEAVHSGDYALKVIPGTDAYRRIYQEVENLTPGNFYEASVWVLVSGDSLTSKKGIDLLVLGSSAVGWDSKWAGTTTNQSYKVTTTNSKWTKLTTYWQQPADATKALVAFDMQMMSESLSTICYFDDAAVREITGFDGSFETGFETVSTEKLSDNESIYLPHDIAFLNRTNKSFAAFAGEVSASMAAAHTGTYGLQMIPNSSYGRRALLYVPNLTAGKTYKLTAYMKVTATETLASGANIYVGPTYDVTDNDMWKKGTAQTSATDWKKVQMAFTVADCNYAYIQFLAGKVAEGNSVATYFDDVTIEETNIKFTDAVDGTVNATATVVGAEGDVARMIVGVYDTVNGTPSLAEVYVSESVTLTSTKWKEITIENISLSAGQYAKAMLLDGAAGLAPLTAAKLLTVESAS